MQIALGAVYTHEDEVFMNGLLTRVYHVYFIISWGKPWYIRSMRKGLSKETTHFLLWLTCVGGAAFLTGALLGVQLVLLEPFWQPPFTEVHPLDESN